MISENHEERGYGLKSDSLTIFSRTDRVFHILHEVGYLENVAIRDTRSTLTFNLLQEVPTNLRVKMSLGYFASAQGLTNMLQFDGAGL